jgi:hypothetical protein
MMLRQGRKRCVLASKIVTTMFTLRKCGSIAVGSRAIGTFGLRANSHVPQHSLVDRGSCHVAKSSHIFESPQFDPRDLPRATRCREQRKCHHPIMNLRKDSCLTLLRGLVKMSAQLWAESIFTTFRPPLRI